MSQFSMKPSGSYKDFAPPGALAQAANSAELLRLVRPERVQGIYIHVPFCFHKCSYCDFYSVVADKGRHEAYAERLMDEIRTIGPLLGSQIRTLYVGGGTPTLLKASLWRKILAALKDAFDLSELKEFSVEGNPETFSPRLVEVLAAGGMNRLSVGAQSFQPRHLNSLERWHDPAHVARAVGIARGAGIANINLDLIFAIPGQSADDWLADIEETLALEPSHISCYALTYAPGTPLSKRATLGLQPCDEQAEAGMYGSAIDKLPAAGFRQYEISNFALPDYECLHNLLYWENENWLALGPGAAGHLNGVRWKNAPDLERYLASSGGAPIQDVELLDADASFGEQLMLRLRLTNGVPLDWLAPRLDLRRGQIIELHLAMGLLERTPTHLRLTRPGMLVANRIVEELL